MATCRRNTVTLPPLLLFRGFAVVSPYIHFYHTEYQKFEEQHWQKLRTEAAYGETKINVCQTDQGIFAIRYATRETTDVPDCGRAECRLAQQNHDLREAYNHVKL
jgi:hypothetical protein